MSEKPINYELVGFSQKHSADQSVVNLGNALSSSLSLHDLGIHIMQPHERKDAADPIHYTTLGQTVKNWQEDPHGQRIFDFFTTTTGMSNEELQRVLADEGGMKEYMKWKQEGRYVSVFGAQVLKPTYYYMTKVIVPALLQHEFGIPTSVLIINDPEDTFHTGNGDKITGKVEFPVGFENGKMESVYVEIRPYGVREKDGSIRRITEVGQANGYACKDVLIQVVDAGDSYNNHFTISNKIQTGKHVITQYQGALGMDIPGLVHERQLDSKGQEVVGETPQNAVSLTDFYEILWQRTIDSLRESGVLPDEASFPIAYVNASQLYGALGKHAKKVPEVLDILTFTAPAIQQLHDLFLLTDQDIEEIGQEIGDSSPEAIFAYVLEQKGLEYDKTNGLLVHKSNGVMDPASFYVWESAWSDLFLECASCVEPYMRGKIKRGQEVQKAFGLPLVEVRLPDKEIPALEQYLVHPTGRYADVQHARHIFGDSVKYLGTQQKVLGDSLSILKGINTTFDYDEFDGAQELLESIGCVKAQIAEKRTEFETSIQEAYQGNNLHTSDFFVPQAVVGLWKEYMSSVSQSLNSTIRRRKIKNSL